MLTPYPGKCRHTPHGLGSNVKVGNTRFAHHSNLDYLIDAWELMTDGGLHVSINETPSPENPWGLGRFRYPAPPGGLRLMGWDDSNNGR